MNDERKGMLLIVSGPSGVGKGTLNQKLLATDPSFRLSCSATTRAPREGEIDGVHYHFLSQERYDELLSQNAFLEHAQVHGNCYGTLEAPVREMMDQGLNVLLEIDQQGAINVMQKMQDYVSVFILPPSFADLEARLMGRGTETPETLKCRLNNARGEIEKAGAYQYVIVNDNLETAFTQLQAIVAAEKQRLVRYTPAILKELN